MAKNRTINEKNFNTIIKELCEPMEGSTRDFDGMPYIPIEEYEERLNNVVGVFNYNFKVEFPQFVQTGSEQNIIVKGSLEILDDDGNIVVVKETAGGKTVIYLNDDKKQKTTQPKMVSNDVEIACNDAFKRCCKKLGMGNITKKEQNSSNNTSKSSYLELQINGAFEVKNNNYYRVPVYNAQEDENAILVIWNSEVQKIKKVVSMEKFVNMYTPGTTLKLYGKKNLFNNEKQYIMTDIYVSNKEEGHAV